jgi:hypothetical protein
MTRMRRIFADLLSGDRMTLGLIRSLRRSAVGSIRGSGELGGEGGGDDKNIGLPYFIEL